MKLNAWITAFRLRTLPLALACIGMGGFLAALSNEFDISIFLLCCLTTLLLQILSNLANDYGDFVNGADQGERKGPARMVQTGIISTADMKTAIIIFSALSFLSGLFLLWTVFGTDWKYISFFVVIGVMSILAAIAYTIGKRPYGYAGLGDVSVLIFFGFVGVLGSLFLYTKSFDWLEILPAISCGLFAVAVLNLNNMRDMVSDKKAGKNSIPVRIGTKNAALYHIMLLSVGLFCSVFYVLYDFRSWNQFLFLAVIPLLFINGYAVYKKESVELDPFLKQMAFTTLIYVILFGTGMLIGNSSL